MQSKLTHLFQKHITIFLIKLGISILLASMCLFQYTIWSLTWASTAVGSTVWRQSQHQRQSFYARRGYKSPTNYYAAINQQPTTARVQDNYVLLWRWYPSTTTTTRIQLRDYKSTTNHYAENNLLPTTVINYYAQLRREFTNCYYVSTTRSSVQFIRLQTTTFHLWNQLTHRKRSPLQL